METTYDEYLARFEDTVTMNKKASEIKKTEKVTFDSADYLMKVHDEKQKAKNSQNIPPSNTQKPQPKKAKKQFYTIPSPFTSLIDDTKTIEFTRESNPFNLMGAYPEPKIRVPYEEGFEKTRYNKINYGLFNDQDYCEEVDFYNLANPHNIFTKQNFFSDYSRDSNYLYCKDK